MEQLEKRNKRVQLNFTEEEYEHVKEEAEIVKYKMATFCRKLIMDKKVWVEYREPAEMAMLERIFETMSRILDEDMEMLRQLRLMGEWTEESLKTIEEQIKQLLLVRRDLEGDKLNGDH